MIAKYTTGIYDKNNLSWTLSIDILKFEDCIQPDKRTESRFCKSWPCDLLLVLLYLHTKIDYQHWLVSLSVDSVTNAEKVFFSLNI